MNSYESRMKTAPSTPNKLDKIVFISMLLTVKNNQQTVVAGLVVQIGRKAHHP